MSTTARTRSDAAAKVTGRARFAADQPVAGLRHAVLVTAAVPSGRIRMLDTAEAEAAPGVEAVLTHRNALRLSPIKGLYMHRLPPLQDDRVHYEGQPIALVVAEQPEQARAAAAELRIEYDPEVVPTVLDDALAEAWTPTPIPRWGPADTAVGDVGAGLAAADLVIERRYRTANRHHNAMEPSATTAHWDADGGLTLYDSTQGVANVQTVIASALGLDPAQVHVVCPWTGGGFGSKGHVWPHQIIASMAARMLGGGVRLVLTRAQSFTSHGYQPATRQTVTLGATSEGRLTAIRHVSLNQTARYAEYPELAATGTRTAYACPAIETAHLVAPVATIVPTPMRAPHEGPGMFALESAMDELATEIGMDPLELRMRNYAETDPTTGEPFSSKELRACYLAGSRLFGWGDRPASPRSRREGHKLIGSGMATALMNQYAFPASARVGVSRGGEVVVETGTQEIGTGTYTVLGQIAAETLGCSPDRVTVRLGDSGLPPTGMSAGSSTTLSVGSAVRSAAGDLLERLAVLERNRDPAEPVEVPTGSTPEDRWRRLTRRLAHGSAERLWGQGQWAPQDNGHSLHTFGAVFAEVEVDEDLGLVRVRRMVGVYSAGRIINPLTARSQMTGGMVWGIGQALLEQSTTDSVLGRFVSKNMAGYLVPVQADVPELHAEFIDEYDSQSGTIGARGVGELGAVGVAAAIANAVHHATGTRIRELPITPEAVFRDLR
jgi:xanthine dehydrogenase YagR molybdenum-binding subunit